MSAIKTVSLTGLRYTPTGKPQMPTKNTNWTRKNPDLNVYNQPFAKVGDFVSLYVTLSANCTGKLIEIDESGYDDVATIETISGRLEMLDWNFCGVLTTEQMQEFVNYMKNDEKRSKHINVDLRSWGLE